MSSKLYVGNLPFSATEESLKSAFSQFGTVESATVITDRDTGQSKGFGFVELGTKQEAANAIAKMNGSELDGRTIKVSEAKPQAPREGGGGARGFGGGGGRGFGGGGGGGYRR
jgi:cold-inducible RNA-binding protein